MPALIEEQKEGSDISVKRYHCCVYETTANLMVTGLLVIILVNRYSTCETLSTLRVLDTKDRELRFSHHPFPLKLAGSPNGSICVNLASASTTSQVNI